MSKTTADDSRNTLQIIECPVRAAEHFARHRGDIYATRPEVIGALARGGRTLEEASATICDAYRDDGLLRDPTDQARLIPVDSLATLLADVDDPDLDPIEEPDDPATLLAFLEDYLECTTDPSDILIGRINERRQQLRNGDDS